MDWDPSAEMDQEAAVEAEIQRRRRAREAALKRAAGNAALTPAIQALQGSENPLSTPGSTRQNTPGPQKTEVNTPQSSMNPVQVLGHRNLANQLVDDPSTPMSPSRVQGGMSPAGFNFANDQDLVKTHGDEKADEVDGPSAADYDPTVDMREDERRDEMRHGIVGLHGELRQPQTDDSSKPVETQEEPTKDKGEDEDDFDMFADNFEEKLGAPEPTNGPAAQKGLPLQAGMVGGGNVDGDDKDGYYKIRPGEILEGRYQIVTALGRGMFSGVARAIDLTTQQPIAIKIMRNNDALRKGGFTEIAILQKLNNADPENKKHIVKFERSFEYKGHLCMVFESLSLNLREVLKKFGNNVGINLNATRAYAYQIFLALGHMRKCSIIHADLKPDNILVSLF